MTMSWPDGYGYAHTSNDNISSNDNNDNNSSNHHQQP